MDTDLLSEMVSRKHRLEREIDSLEDDVKQRKHDLERLLRVELPAALCDVDEVVFEGTRIKVETRMKVSVTAEHREAAADFLTRVGEGAVVKYSVEISPDDLFRLRQEFPAAVISPSVHHKTLDSVVRILLERGDAVPLDIFSVFTYREATMKIATRRG